MEQKELISLAIVLLRFNIPKMEDHKTDPNAVDQALQNLSMADLVRSVLQRERALALK